MSQLMIDKHGYLDSDFSLTFATIDHLTVARIGPGAHIYKIDGSCIFSAL